MLLRWLGQVLGLLPPPPPAADHSWPAKWHETTDAAGEALAPLSMLTVPPRLFGDRPGPARRKTLVLDLDETLIHSTPHVGRGNHDMVMEIYVNGYPAVFYVHKRPHVDQFLETVAQWYDVVVFTASMRTYGNQVVDLLDRGHSLFKQRLFRDSCTEVTGLGYVKDLTLIQPDLSQILIVDDSRVAYTFNPHNAIPILAWKDDPMDDQLLDLALFLTALRDVDDVRSVLGRRMKGSN